jgi:Ca-activated chloride channel homolog
VIVAKSIAALLLVVTAASAGASPPLTAADVVRFLKAGISEPTILTELQGRGFAEPLDAEREAALREAGATETLMVAIRRVAKAPPPAPAVSAPTPPPSAYATGVVVTPMDAKELTFAVAARTVRVPVSVLDAKGEPVLGLHDTDFRISEDGKRQGVTFFSGERRPLRIALALDVSRSMENKIRQVEEALRHFVDLLEPSDEILVMTFSDRLHVVQDFTSDRQRLARVLDNLEVSGGTALYDAAYESLQRVASGPAESKAVVLVTDGVDTASSVVFDDLREFARRKEVPVFSIGLDSGDLMDRIFSPPRRDPGVRRPGWPMPPPGGGPGRGWPGGGGGRIGGTGGGPAIPGGGGGGFHGQRRGFDEKPLLELADDTGGRAEIVRGLQHYSPSDDLPGGDRLKQAVESIAMTLRHRYLLGYEPPEGKQGWRAIEVEVTKRDTTPRARKGYYAGG